MTEKTLKDCAACPMVLRCDAHNTRGTWHHQEGIDPCRVVLSADKKDFINLEK